MLPFLATKIPGNARTLVQKWGVFCKCGKREVSFHLELLNVTNF